MHLSHHGCLDSSWWWMSKLTGIRTVFFSLSLSTPPNQSFSPSRASSSSTDLLTSYHAVSNGTALVDEREQMEIPTGWSVVHWRACHFLCSFAVRGFDYADEVEHQFLRFAGTRSVYLLEERKKQMSTTVDSPPLTETEIGRAVRFLRQSKNHQCLGWHRRSPFLACFDGGTEDWIRESPILPLIRFTRLARRCNRCRWGLLRFVLMDDGTIRDGIRECLMSACGHLSQLFLVQLDVISSIEMRVIISRRNTENKGVGRRRAEQRKGPTAVFGLDEVVPTLSTTCSLNSSSKQWTILSRLNPRHQRAFQKNLEERTVFSVRCSLNTEFHEPRFFTAFWYLSSNALIWTFSILVRGEPAIVVRLERAGLGSPLSRMIGRRGLSLRFAFDEDRLIIDWRERRSMSGGGGFDRSLIIRSEWSKLRWLSKDFSWDDCRCRRNFSCVAFSRRSWETEGKWEKRLARQRKRQW